MTPQHFLVPLDFSGYSTQALDYAMELAHKLQARLTLLHVIQSLSMGGDDIDVTLPYAYMQELDAELTAAWSPTSHASRRQGSPAIWSWHRGARITKLWRPPRRGRSI